MAEPENPAVPAMPMAMEKNIPELAEAEGLRSEFEVKPTDMTPSEMEQQPTTTTADSQTAAETNVNVPSVPRAEASCLENPVEGTVMEVSKSEPLAEAKTHKESHGSDVKPAQATDPQPSSSDKESSLTLSDAPPDVQPSALEQPSVVCTENPSAEKRELTTSTDEKPELTATNDEKRELTATTDTRDSDKSTEERVPESVEPKLPEAERPQETPTVLAITGDATPHVPEAKTSSEKSVPVEKESMSVESQKKEEKDIEPEPVKETSTTDRVPVGGPMDTSQPPAGDPLPKEPGDATKVLTDTEKASPVKDDGDQKTFQPTESDNSRAIETPLPQVQRPPSPSQSSKLEQPTAASSESTEKTDIEMIETASQPSLTGHVRKSISAPDLLTRADKKTDIPFESVVTSAEQGKDSSGTQEEKREFQSVSESEVAPFRGLQQESQAEESRASFMIWDENSMDVPQSEGSGGFTFGDENSMDLMATNENSTDLIPDDSSMDNIPSTNENSMDIEQARANLESKAAALIDERSQSSTKSTSRRRRGSPVASAQPEKEKEFTAQQLFEYQWPQEKNGEWFMLQEQISEYLGILSFKRKYPDLQRRAVFPNERVFLREKGIVTEMQCDLGLTALKVDEVCDLLAKDYPDKYKTYIEILREREKQRIKDQHKDYDQPKLEKSKMNAYIKKAVKAAAEFNSQFNRERREERRAYFDLQTMEIHYPVHTIKRLPPEDTKVSAYPVALIPGQFQDFYKMYTPQELKYFPLNTAMYSPPRSQKDIYADPNACTDDDEEDAGKAAAVETEDDGSSSSSDSSEESSDDSDKEVEETPTTEPDTDTASQKSERSTPKSRGSRTPASRTPKSASMKNLAREVFSKVIGGSSSKTTASGKLIGRPPGSRGTKRKGDVIPKCALCKGTANKNKLREPEELITCSECGSNGHPSCLDLTKEMVAIIKTYNWQCMECKTCSKCLDSGHEDRMMFCDRCDRGCHTFCLGLTDIPTGRWECPTCLLSAETVAKAVAAVAEVAPSTDSASMATSTEDKPPDPKKAKTE